ncbi:MAG TPA: S-adenosylmethionine decarboxylase [Candidatus Avacidaminococcus intestinavium]|uniref:S-adenosylmethionine decarboxylase n=1 Tax=Candidatus Avacidaminococcus intestinavium TaxID=2840684 RepID=A0A9D1SKM9_9FIRM|nr:S-adenosylmethionine decarboxylase [Candidatus Avacidaminococcus intestinavium]
MALKGAQIAIDMYSCKYDFLSNNQLVEATLKKAITDYKFGAYAIYHYTDEDNEYSFCIPCQRGHINLHVYPELGFVAVDIFTCKEDADSDRLAGFLKKQFSPDKAKITFLQRGDFGSQNDMKPRRKSQVKPMHRAKNAGKKLLKIVMGPKKS